MTTPQSNTAPGELRLPVQAKLAAAWASIMSLYIYVDYLGLYIPGFIDEIRSGTVHRFETGPMFVSLGITLMAIPAVMIVLSAALPARVNRIVNLVVATLYIPVTVYNGDGEPAAYAYFYGFSIVVELLILAYVLRLAWTLRPAAARKNQTGSVGRSPLLTR